MKLCTCAVVFCITLAWVAPLSADVFTLLHTLDDPTPTTFDGFGGAVAVSADYALVADPADGLAHLFDAHTAALLRSFDVFSTTVSFALASAAIAADHHPPPKLSPSSFMTSMRYRLPARVTKRPG